jgi:ankyrin repeat protein
MANFEGDIQQAAVLGSKLLEKIDPNFIDKEGKSPLHVAIKKEQLLALKFAL